MEPPSKGSTTQGAAPAKPSRMAPVVTPESKFFWDASSRGEFVGQRCGACGAYRFPPAPMCPKCCSLDTQVVKLSGRGKVVSWIKPVYPAGYGFGESLVVGVIRLDEGLNFVSNIVGVPYETIHSGMPVEVSFEDTTGNKKIPVFAPMGQP